MNEENVALRNNNFDLNNANVNYENIFLTISAMERTFGAAYAR